MHETDDTSRDVHPREADFEAFVTGALEGEPADVFERHVTGCAACAARLRAEAIVEEKFYDAMATSQRRAAPLDAPRPIARRLTRLRPALAVAAALAFAAGVVALITRPDPRAPALEPKASDSPRPTTIPAVVCDDLMTQAACVEEAHRHGLYVRHPSGAGAPPLGGAPSGGPAGSPFPLSSRRSAP